MEMKIPFLRRLVVDKKIRGLKPARTIRRGRFKRVYEYHINSIPQYRKALGRMRNDTKVISFVGIN